MASKMNHVSICRTGLSYVLSKLSNLRVNLYHFKTYTDSHDVSYLSKYSYWREKYARENENNTSFDWFLEANDFKDRLADELSNMEYNDSQLNVLDIGCGNSSLPCYLYKAIQSPISLFCADFVFDALVIQKHWLTETSPANPNSIASFITCNACNIPFLNNKFHMVMDKGTMDALLKNSVDGKRMSQLMMSEVYRIICRGGKYIQITDEDPDLRLPLLEDLTKKLPCRFSWSFRTIECDSNKEYFMFQFTKKTEGTDGNG